MTLRTRWRTAAAGIAVLVTLAAVLLTGLLPGLLSSQPRAGGSAAGAPAGSAYDEPLRPQMHFSPARNWMNDPNGLIHLDGEYHYFFQYNPTGDVWGNMSWGHAVSTDLVHWVELPVAIEGSPDERIFSGSVVVDRQNVTGFGSPERPAMVAVYTSWYEASSRHQAQSLAYSLDRGRTWKRYAGNPVLTGEQDGKDPLEFRDPKVFWHEGTRSWIMALALATQQKIAFYRSTDLKKWTHLSDFGPAGAVGGAWECPDLFELPVDGDPARKRWVLSVNLNPGSIAGGSGAQYFTGSFDGTRFVSDDPPTYTPPTGRVLADFEGASHPAGWTATGTAFGDRPATGALAGQQTVTGFTGTGLANSFVGGDGSVGTLTSPPFTVDRNHLNLLVGGGAHRWVPGTGDGAAPVGTVLGDFEGADWAGWTVTGDAFGTRPTRGEAPCQVNVRGYLGGGLLNSFHAGDPDACDLPPDAGTGTATSPPFTIGARHLSFLVGGGAQPSTAVRLLVDGQVVRTTSGRESGTLAWASWDLADLAGRTARIEVVDQSTGGWGHVLADHFVLADQPARPRSTETSVNLLVDGAVVRSVSGSESEMLDWASWNVSALRGRQARVQLVDANTGGWGHLLADQVVLSDTPARSRLERAHWQDYGRDYYAAVSFADEPKGRRVMMAWMSNWQYANQTPTSPWRSSATLPRELSLRTIDGRVQLVQQPVAAVDALAGSTTYRLSGARLREGTTALGGPGTSGRTLRVDLRLNLREAREAGVRVLTGPGEQTVIGYDRVRQQVYVDRTRSGQVGFERTFPSVDRAPLPSFNGTVRLRVYVDRSSVEVFAGQGQVTLTDQVFPSATSTGVQLFSTGGRAVVESLTITPMRSAWRP
ncbi:MAG TPA: GH32 C-terminal domain-containing protein [Actinomycetales bacterium]|jgi:levanase